MSLNSLKEHLFEPDDEIASRWLLMDNPLLIAVIIALYWLFVWIIGPILMRVRTPIDPKLLIKVYNLFQVIACSAMVLWPFTNAKLAYSMFAVGCGDCLPKDSVEYYQLKRYSWCYFMLKIIDYLDTIFMVIRKKQNQVTFLHVYHHISVTIVTLLFVRYTFSEQVPINAFMNNLVHAFMYGYYFLASIGPEMQKRLWWKKYITMLQLVQFVLISGVSAYALFANCQINKFGTTVAMIYPTYFIYLFGKFYIASYTGKKKVQ